jgi:UDP-N-acetylglucosamine acyltransferase
MKIHETAIIDSNAVIGEGVIIGPYTRVEGDVVIEQDCEIMQGAQLLDGVRLGARTKIFQGSIIGALPQDKKFKGGRSYCTIGEDSTIREYVTISRSTQLEGATKIGKNAYIMTGAHIAHDCEIGDGVTMANLVTLAGHVKIESLATIGGMTVIHQFVRVGELAMIGGDSGLMLDAPPYMISFGYPPAKVWGINAIGLKRNEVDEASRMLLKKAYRYLYRSNLNFAQAVERIQKEMPNNQYIQHLIEFFKGTKRGISTSSHTPDTPSFTPHNGHDVTNINSMMGLIRNEDALKEIIALIESKVRESTQTHV